MAAGIWLRLKAFIWDYIWIGLYLGFVFILSMFLIPEIQGLFTGSLGKAQLTGFFFVTLPVSLYFSIGDSERFQGTFGKRKIGVRVVAASSGPVSFLRSFWRVILKFLPWELSHFLVYRLIELENSEVPFRLIAVVGIVYAMIFTYLLSAIFSDEKRSLYDLLSGTKVIRNNKHF